jgi:hypothetical protein
MGPQLKTAFIRALIVGFFTALLTLLTNMQQGQSLKEALLAAAIALVTVVMARGLGEGGYDANRDRAGDVKPSDVGPAAVVSPT